MFHRAVDECSLTWNRGERGMFILLYSIFLWKWLIIDYRLLCLDVICYSRDTSCFLHHIIKSAKVLSNHQHNFLFTAVIIKMIIVWLKVSVVIKNHDMKMDVKQKDDL